MKPRHIIVEGTNEKGLYITLFHDTAAVGSESGAPAGMDISRLTLLQVMGVLQDTCATVEEAKKEILCHHIMQVVLNVHMLIADASGNATFLEFDLSKEHNTFSRQILLRDKFTTLKPPYKREDVTVLTDAVHCAFIDHKKAEAAPKILFTKVFKEAKHNNKHAEGYRCSI